MAQYPTSAGTDANLFVAVNNLSTSLTDNPLTSGATTVNVASTTGFPTTGFITIEAEAIQYTGITGTSFTGCTRGADGTTAASHVNALQVSHFIVAAHRNVIKDEIKAIENDLVAVQSTITPVTATPTATSVLNRLAMLAKQIVTLSGQATWDAAAPSLIDNPLNLITNGGFERGWEVGTTFSSPVNGTAIASGWNIQTGGGTPATTTVSKDTTNMDTGSAVCLSFNVTAAGTGITNSLRIEQHIPNFADYASQWVTVTARVKCNVASAVRLVVDSGDAGVYSSYHTGGGTYETLTVTRQMLSNLTLMRIKIGMTSADVKIGQFYVDNVMLVKGQVALPYNPVDPGIDQQRCEQFIQSGGSSANPCYLYGQGASDGTNYYIGGFQAFRTLFPGIPAVTLTVNHVNEDGSSSNVEGSYTLLTLLPSQSGFTARAAKAIAGSRPATFSFYWTAVYSVP